MRQARQRERSDGRTMYAKIVDEVIRASDIILEVLDARLVQATRNRILEERIRRLNKPLLFVLNKCDLVDKRYMEKVKRILRPSVFVSAKDRLGTTMLRNKMLEIAGKEKLVAGIIGYPNTGKSSVINALAGRRKAGTSAQSGFTRGLQKVKVDNRIWVLDTPGVIPYDDKVTAALTGAKDHSKIEDPEGAAFTLIEHMLPSVKSYYSLESVSPEEIIEEVALKKNKLIKGGLPDTQAASRLIIMDWQRGKIRPVAPSAL